MAQVKTAISIRDDLLQKVNTVANELNISRSGLFEKAVEQFLLRYESEQLTEQINQAYETPLTDDEKESLKMIRSLQRKLSEQEGDEWK